MLSRNAAREHQLKRKRISPPRLLIYFLERSFEPFRAPFSSLNDGEKKTGILGNSLLNSPEPQLPSHAYDSMEARQKSTAAARRRLTRENLKSNSWLDERSLLHCSQWKRGERAMSFHTGHVACIHLTSVTDVANRKYRDLE